MLDKAISDNTEYERKKQYKSKPNNPLIPYNVATTLQYHLNGQETIKQLLILW